MKINVLILVFIPVRPFNPYLSTIQVHQLHGVPGAVGVGADGGVFVGHRVNGEPHGHQLVVHVSGSKVAVARFLIFLFPGER